MTVDIGPSDDTFDVLRRGLDPERLTDLTITIGHYNSLVHVLAAIGIDVEPDYLTYLDEFPLPAEDRR